MQSNSSTATPLFSRDLERIRQRCRENAEIARRDSFTRTRIAQIQAKTASFDKAIPGTRK